jgi:hypothetical protein
MLAVLYPSTILASLFVAGRLFSRRLKLGRWAVDDYIMLLSLVGTTPPTLVPAHRVVFLSRGALADRGASIRD